MRRVGMAARGLGLSILMSILLFPPAVVSAQPSRGESEKGNLHGVPMIDPAFDGAAKEARRSLRIFLAKWRAKPEGYSAFRIKAGFRTDDLRGEEYLWFVPDAVASDGKVLGRLSNDPDRIARLRAGAPVQVEPSKIVDWMYVKDGKMFGQYTMRAQLDRATPQQRAQFVAMLSPTPLESGDH